MMIRKNALTPGCPWYELAELRAPNVKWCENPVCSWVVEPANAWSNLAYIIAGIAMWQMAKKASRSELKLYGPAALAVGIGSLLYHMSDTFVLQVLDFYGMDVFCWLLILINLKRAGIKLPLTGSNLGVWTVSLLTTVLTVSLDFMDIPIQGTIAVLITGIVVSEILAQRKHRTSLKWFGIGLATFGAAFVCEALDFSRVWCDPDNHWIQGHATWHLLGACALVFSYFHHKQALESSGA